MNNLKAVYILPMTDVDAAEKIAEDISKIQPDTILILSPDTPIFNDIFYLNLYSRVSGYIPESGKKQSVIGFNNNVSLAQAIADKSAENSLEAGAVPPKAMKQNNYVEDLQKGIILPLLPISQKYPGFTLAPLAISGASLIDHYRYGKTIADAVNNETETAVFIMSYDNNPITPEEIINLLTGNLDFFYSGETKGLLPRLANVTYGICDATAYQTEKITADAIALYFNNESSKSLLPHLQGIAEDLKKARLTGESDPVKLVRSALSANEDGEVCPAPNNNFFQNDAKGVYITLKKDGQLIADGGTIFPLSPTIGEEIIANTIAIAPNLTAEEAQDYTITVYIIDNAEEVHTPKELNPAKYGLYIDSSKGQGVILPGDPNITTADEQLRRCLNKGGISIFKRKKYYRFTATIYR